MIAPQTNDAATRVAPAALLASGTLRPRLPVLELIDRSLAGTLLIISSPLLALVILVTWFLSGRRSPFVAHQRVSTRGRVLWMLKFRTMWSRAQRPNPNERGLVERVVSADVSRIKPQVDPRVSSRFAAWCRIHSIDELPQLWHVVRGEMSLVGPRPLTSMELEQYYGERASEVLSLPPGLTGLWQVRGRSQLSYRRRLRLDLFLVRNYSLRLYFKILLSTIPRVFSGVGAR